MQQIKGTILKSRLGFVEQHWGREGVERVVGALSDDDQRALRTQLADSLADAGRPREAATHFLDAAAHCDAQNALELRRRASGAQLQAGFIAEGMELTKQVLRAVGMRMAKTPLRALMHALLRRAWLRVRGLGFTPRPLNEISQAELTRVDVCEGTSFGLALVDSFAAMDFSTRFLHLALRLGDPWRVSKALAFEIDWLAAMAQKKRALRLLARLEEMTLGFDNPTAESQVITTRALVDFFLHNKFGRAREQMTEAIAIYTAAVGRASIELDTINIFCNWTLYYRGELAELSRRVPAMAEAASRNGNNHTAVTLHCAFAAAWLAHMDPDDIEQGIIEALASWSTPGGAYQLQHFLALMSRIELALYRGRPEEVTGLIAAERGPMRRSMVDRPPIHAMLLSATMGRYAVGCAAAAAPGSSRRREMAHEAHKIARRCRKSPLPLMHAISQFIDGGASEVEGHTDEAVAQYRACLTQLDASDAFLYTHAVRYRLGGLVGGDEGAALRAASVEHFRNEGTRDPEKMLRMLIPG
jgi:hypothetical protein